MVDRGHPAHVHTPGHVGLGFATAIPVVLALDAAGLGALALPTTAALVGLSTLPDCDEWIPGMAHRGGTHSIPFALAVGLGAAAVGYLAGPAIGGGRGVAAGLGFAVGALAVAVHVLADVVTPMGVYPLWPVSAERRSLGLVRSADRRLNAGLLVGGLGGWLVVWLAVLP